ncbi:MAG: hypothetical protein RMI34_05490 [Chloroherpetonaceae bacterium]|nr:hypothetical protein [Chloroherpetonaceae bacterium]MCS7210769.1 hypothetical protein [Chloroherpetonaceae bacterium]MDW8019513.1 hypothetical protein [Chloroherpetonaceae bacterium]
MRKRLLTLLLAAMLSAATVSELHAQYVFTAASRLIRTQEALNPKSGSLTFFSHFDFNTTAGAYTGQLGNLVAHSIVTNSIHLDYAFTNNILVALNPVVYTDIHHQDAASNVFERIFLTAKVASFGIANDYVYLGGMATVMLPLAQRWNQYGNPYSAGGPELGINLLLSYYADNLFPRESFNLNLNLGLYNYFDSGKNISNTPAQTFKVESNSAAITYSIGAKYPTASVDLMLEIWGWAYISEPPAQAYTRESMTFISAGVRLKPVEFLALTLGFDYQLAGREDRTQYGPFGIVRRPPNAPTNYTEWRALFGVQFNILPIAFGSTADPSLIDFTTGSQGSDIILRKLEDIGDDKESTARKIEELRRRRQDIEKNLQQLRAILKETEPAKPEEKKPEEKKEEKK